MTNKIKCGDCEKFWAIQKGLRGGKTVPQSRGHCLARSVYPKDKPGEPVYPPGARIRELPNNVGEVYVVHENQVISSCRDAIPKEKKK